MKAQRVALYARVSTADQDVGLQLEELRELASQRGWKIVNEYVDAGVSGATTARPSLDRMLADAQAGRLDLVVVWKLDRLGRSLQHILSVLDQLACWGVGFTSARDPGIDTTSPAGRLLLQVLGAFAEFERGLIRERVRAGLERARSRGTRLGRPVVDVDLEVAIQLIRGGSSVATVAAIMNVSRTTLRRRLTEAGLID